MAKKSSKSYEKYKLENRKEINKKRKMEKYAKKMAKLKAKKA